MVKLDDIDLEAEVSKLKTEKSALNRKLKIAMEKAATFSALAQELHQQVIPLKALPKAKIISPKKAKVTEHLVMHLSDEHADAVVIPEKVNGFEDYNFLVALRRAERYVKSVLDYTQNTLVNYSFPELWILVYGDHTSGEIHKSVERSYFKNILRNTLAIGQMHSLMFRDLAPYFKKVHVVYVSGNHGRRTPTKDYHGAHDNWDYLVAETARAYCNGIPNIDFLIPDAFAVALDINGHGFLVSHGDDIKSWAGISWYGIDRKVKKLRAIYAAQKKYISYYVFGHFHQPAFLADLDGEIIINGSWVATDPYALGAVTAFTEPSQWIHGCHEKYGLTWRMKIKLRQDEDKSSLRYQSALPMLRLNNIED